MSEPTSGSGAQLRTLAVRITEDLRAQLDVVAQITGRTTTEEIRLALEHWIERTKSDPATLQKAAAVRAEIERNAQTQRNAIASIFGGDGAAASQAEVPATDSATGTTEPSAPARPASRRGKQVGE